MGNKASTSSASSSGGGGGGGGGGGAASSSPPVVESSEPQDIFISTEEDEPEDYDEDKEIPPGKLSYWQMAKLGYQQLVNAIIRPPRCNYSLEHLGPKTFKIGDKKFYRRDFELRNPRGLLLMCSQWSPEVRANDVLPCVIYMHGNSSARLEGIPQLLTVLALGATMLSFDFAGSGLSDGEYVSLGAFEKDDLKAVIEYLREEGLTSSIALWGRSMGAATAMLHGERDPSIAGMVLDSAFSDLQTLAEEIVDKGRKNGLFVPGFVVYIAIRFIRSSVLKTANFDIRTLTPIKHAHRCFIPALFVAAEGDNFVSAQHSRRIHEKYAGDKNLLIVDGDHNTPRPKFLYDSVSIFLQQTLQIPDHWVMNLGSDGGPIPPWNLRSLNMNDEDVSTDDLDFFLDMNEEEVGMTEARQENIQRALKNLMGHSKAEAITGSSAADLTADFDPSAITTRNSGSAPSTTSSWSTKRRESLGNTATTCKTLREKRADWECSRCTLINESTTNVCIACGLSFVL